MISKSNPKLFRGYLLKEKLRLVFQHPFAKAKEELAEWLAWAQRCRIPQFVELQEKIKRHFEAILSSVKFGLSNARIEAINNKIKVSIRMAYGFRNIENMLAEERLQARVKAEEANDVWTVDFKGWWWTGRGEKCLPLTVRDEAKKYILAIETLEKGDTAHVKAVFELLFRKYGLPGTYEATTARPLARYTISGD